MIDRNTINKGEYIFENVLWACVVAVWYRVLIFMPLDGCTVVESKIILYALILVFVSAGIAVTYKKRRNYVNLITNIIFPYQLYATISYLDYLKSWVVTTVVVTAVLSASYFLLVLFHKKINNKSDYIRIVKIRIRHGLLGMRIVSVLCLCAFVVPLTINFAAGGNLYSATKESAITDYQTDECTISNNIDTVSKIKPDIWDTLTVSERLNVLETLKNIEMQYLGINHELYLRADNLDEGTLGCYVSNEHKIIIDVHHLTDDSVYEVVHTLAHECHHAYSEQLVELYHVIPDEYKNMLLFYNTQKYAEEYENYYTADESYYMYSRQYCEKHADFYAESAVKSYYEAIAEYEKGES